MLAFLNATFTNPVISIAFLSWMALTPVHFLPFINAKWHFPNSGICELAYTSPLVFTWFGALICLAQVFVSQVAHLHDTIYIHSKVSFSQYIKFSNTLQLSLWNCSLNIYWLIVVSIVKCIVSNLNSLCKHKFILLMTMYC